MHTATPAQGLSGMTWTAGGVLGHSLVPQDRQMTGKLWNTVAAGVHGTQGPFVPYDAFADI